MTKQLIVGKAVSIKDLKTALDKSYSAKSVKEGFVDFQVDPSLTTRETQTYVNPNTNQVLVVHRGTASMSDVFTDLAYSSTGYKAKRFKEAEKIQKQAEAKYGAKNVSTLGHSLGSLISADVGSNSKEIINYNKPMTLWNRKRDNEYQISTKNDPFSWFHKPKKKDTLLNKHVEIDSKTIDPVKEHSIKKLDELDENMMVGNGLKKMTSKELKQVIKTYNRSAKTGHKIKHYGKMKKAELRQIANKIYTY